MIIIIRCSRRSSFLIVVLIIVSGFAFFAFFSRIGGSQAAMGGTPDKIGGGVFWHTLFQQFRSSTATSTSRRAGARRSSPARLDALDRPAPAHEPLIAIMSEAYERSRPTPRRGSVTSSSTRTPTGTGRRKRLAAGPGKGTVKFSRRMVLISRASSFDFGSYDCMQARQSGPYKYTEGLFEIEEGARGPRPSRGARRGDASARAAWDARVGRGSSPPRPAAAAFDDETHARESRRRSAI